jgi:hypothetical protein
MTIYPLIIYPCKELGCFFRLNGEVLESAPMYADGTCDFNDFGEREISDYAKFMFQGKKRTIKIIERIIIGRITQLSIQLPQGAAL